MATSGRKQTHERNRVLHACPLPTRSDMGTDLEPCLIPPRPRENIAAETITCTRRTLRSTSTAYAEHGKTRFELGAPTAA